MADARQALYLIADEMRGMATVGRHFAGSIYDIERAKRIMELAAKVAALAEDRPLDDVRAVFNAEPWHRASPAIGVEATVFDANGAILLVQRKDNGCWAMPGGLNEVGQTPAEAAVRELWEEAGIRGQVTRLLGIFDGPRWGTRAKVHLIHLTFLVESADLSPIPGSETVDARFFMPDSLPEAMHAGHELRVPKAIELARNTETFFDPTATDQLVMSSHQRPSE